MPEEEVKRKKRGYVSSLDGLRALAVVSVLLYHLKTPHVAGGLLGVTVFFVLSGFLITSLLLSEYSNSGTISLPQFWLRRIKRLFPAIVLVIVTTTALCALFNHELLTKMRPDIVPSLFFFNNWWQIFHDISYFEALGSPSPLTTFWSLAIEEQFYLIWPPMLLILLKLKVPKKFMLGLITIGIVASAVSMGILYDPLGDPSRVYYGTDTRAFSLLIGVLGAFLFPISALGREGERKFSQRGVLIFNTIGIASLISLILCIIFMDGYSGFLYRGGMLFVSLISALLIMNIVHPQSVLRSLFSLVPLGWIGTRSYGIYLWHYPLILLMIPRNIAGEAPLILKLLVVAVIFLISEISYTFVENPIRKGALSRLYKKYFVDVDNYVERGYGRRTKRRVSIKEKFANLYKSHIIQMSSVGLLFIIGLTGIIFVPPASSVETANKLREMSNNSNVIEDAKKNADNNSKDENNSNSDQSQSPAQEFKPYSVLLIGDSVSLMTSDNFNMTFPGGHIDSVVNRRIGDASLIYNYYASYSLVGDVIVFSLGTNGSVTDSQFDELMKTVGDKKRVFFVNTRSPQDWMNATNDALRRGCERYENAHLIDWFSYTQNRNDLFDGDGTHLKYQKAPEFVGLVKQTIEQFGGLPYEPTAEEVQQRNNILATK